jgi:5-keto 4-deoxyuronate isomerase
MSKSLYPRPVRLSGRHIQAMLVQRSAEVINISTTGALLVVHAELSVGQSELLTLKRGAIAVQLEVRVVRVELIEPGRSHVAVAYLNVSEEMRRKLPKLAA